MVTILKAGKLPEEEAVEAICPNCKTLFRFKVGEANRISDQRDGDYYSIMCPLEGCNRTVTKQIKPLGNWYDR